MKHLSRHLPALLALSLLVPAIAFADDSFVPLTHLPGLSDVAATPTLPAFLNQLYRICIGAAAVIAVLKLMQAGIGIMTSKGSFSQLTEAKKRISNTFLGLALILSPFIVFSIINPKILDLSLDFSSLQSAIHPQTSPAPVSPTGNATLDKVSAQICAPYQKPPGQLAIMDGLGSCRATKGNGWVKIDNNCCPTDGTKSCCGYLPQDNPPPTDNLNGPASYSIAYQDTAYMTDKATTQTACIAYADQSFPTQAACADAFAKSTAAAKGPYAIAKSCTDTGSHSLTPAAAAAKLRGLPSCPK